MDVLGAIRSESVARRLTLAVWVVSLLIISGRFFVQERIRNSVFDVFTTAGSQWLAGEDFFQKPIKIFRYTPTAAVFFVPWSLLPPRVGEAAWRLVSAGVLAVAILYWFRVCAPDFDGRRRWLALLFALPLAGTSIYNGQANTLLTALLLAAVADAGRERWWRCAALLAAAILLKAWGIAIAGLLVVCFPGPLAGRLLVCLAVGFAVPFLAQQPDYVIQIYQSWFTFLRADARMHVDLASSNLDLWLINRRLGGILSERHYQIVQLASAGALALATFLTCRRAASPLPALRLLTFVGFIWMLVLGPATESSTYALLGPIFAWAMLDPARKQETWAEWLCLAGALVLVMFPVFLDFWPKSHEIKTYGVQPLGTCLLFIRLLLAGKPVHLPLATAPDIPPIPERHP